MTQITLLLQIALILLSTVQSNPSATMEQRNQAFTFANQAVATAMQYLQNPQTTQTSDTQVFGAATEPATSTTNILPTVTPPVVNPPVVVTPPPIVKRIDVKTNSCAVSVIGNRCTVYATYKENGVTKDSVMTVTSDDGGTFMLSKVPDSDTQTWDKSKWVNPFESYGPATAYSGGMDNQVSFIYRPLAAGTRTLTLTVGDFSRTMEVAGQIDKCVGKYADFTQPVQCNQ